MNRIERMIKILRSPLVWYVVGLGDAAIMYGLYRAVR